MTDGPHTQPTLWDDTADCVSPIDTPDADSGEFTPAPTAISDVVIRRSARRKRTVAAFREGDRTVVVAPQRMSQKELDEYVRELVGRLDRRDELSASQDELWKRAQRVVARYFDHDVIEAHKVPVTIRWVTNQNTRWGSCTPADGAIRISHRLAGMPDYVIDCVVMHEIAHLLVTDHGPRFTALMSRFDELDRATAYLEGYSLGENRQR